VSDNATQHYYGLATTSFMLGATTPVAPIQTPLRSGVTQMTYVRTDNYTVKHGDSGRVRHEWFSMSLAPTAHDSDFAGDSCTLHPPKNSSVPLDSMQRTALLMHPDYTHITVKEPPNFMLALLGEIGGASEAYSVFVLLALLAFYKAMQCRQRLVSRKSVGGEVDGEVDAESAAQASCCHALASTLCP